jgi:hypothetical protein
MYFWDSNLAINRYYMQNKTFADVDIVRISVGI